MFSSVNILDIGYIIKSSTKNIKNNRNLFCIVKIIVNNNKNVLYTPNILAILNLLNKFQHFIYNKAKRFNKTFTCATVNRLINLTCVSNLKKYITFILLLKRNMPIIAFMFR